MAVFRIHCNLPFLMCYRDRQYWNNLLITVGCLLSLVALRIASVKSNPRLRRIAGEGGPCHVCLPPFGLQCILAFLTHAPALDIEFMLKEQW